MSAPQNKYRFINHQGCLVGLVQWSYAANASGPGFHINPASPGFLLRHNIHVVELFPQVPVRLTNLCLNITRNMSRTNAVPAANPPYYQQFPMLRVLGVVGGESVISDAYGSAGVANPYTLDGVTIASAADLFAYPAKVGDLVTGTPADETSVTDANEMQDANLVDAWIATEMQESLILQQTQPAFMFGGFASDDVNFGADIYLQPQKTRLEMFVYPTPQLPPVALDPTTQVFLQAMLSLRYTLSFNLERLDI